MARRSVSSWVRACHLTTRTVMFFTVTAVLLSVPLLMNQKQFLRKPAWLEYNTCSPKTNIAFLKTHKCASSAIQNILFRYGDKHNLHFALPEKGNYFGGKQSFKAEMVWSSPLNKLTPNIFAVHTKWNYEEVKKAMPGDTLFFTIVREPTALFQSLFVFTMREEALGLTLDQYVRQVSLVQDRSFGYLGYNQISWDFGMSLQDMDNLTAAHELVQRADAQFGLVMVVERMDESLVLLAKYLCWELSDVLVLQLNSIRDKFKSSISEESRQTLQQRLAPDYLLYNHFLEKFEQQVEAFGRRRMAREVARLQELMALLLNTCNFVRKEASDLTGNQKPWSPKVDGFLATRGGEECQPFTMSNLSYLELLKEKQRRKLNIAQTSTKQMI